MTQPTPEQSKEIEKLKAAFTRQLEKATSVALDKQPSMLYAKCLEQALDKVKTRDGSTLPAVFRKVMLSQSFKDELSFLGDDGTKHTEWLRTLAMLHVKSCSRVLDLFGQGIEEEVLVARIIDIQLPIS